MAPAAVLCGKQPKISESMVKNLAPKLEVVHVCSTVETATAEIPALLKGEAPKPASGLGSNAEGSLRSDVSLIIIGGGYSKADVEAIKSAADAVKPVALFWADISRTVGSGPPSPDVIKGRMMESIEKEEKDGGWAPGLYMY